MVGFNRRFAPISVQIKKSFENVEEPIVVNVRVNAGFIPKDHWTQIKEIGGGRIIGEMCHFIDLMQYFTDSEPIRVYSECINSSNGKITNEDNIAVVVKFKNGSVGNLTYLANGDKSLAKENIEIFGAGKVGVIKDFREGYLYENNKMKKLSSVGKGHKEELEAFLSAIRAGNDAPIPFQSIYLTTLTTLKIVDSLNTGLPQMIEM